MADSRVEVLQSLLAQNPNDCFSRYGLAMEYAKSGNLEQAIKEYEGIISCNPDYVAAYYHGGQTLEKLGRLDEARAMYQRGINVTKRIGDAHTQSELQAALDILES
jgi:tetratricopeptide (TPR) repeat protein